MLNKLDLFLIEQGFEAHDAWCSALNDLLTLMIDYNQKVKRHRQDKVTALG